MRSPARAIAWELRRRHRWGLVALAAYVPFVAAFKLLILGPGDTVGLVPLDQMPSPAVVVPFSVLFGYLLAVFSFGFAGDLAARESIYPHPPVRAAGHDRRTGSLADALWHGGDGELVAGHGTSSSVAVAARCTPDLAGTVRRGIPRLDSGAGVDAVRVAGPACDRRPAVADDDHRRRVQRDLLPGARATDGRRSWRRSFPSRFSAPGLPWAGLAAVMCPIGGTCSLGSEIRASPAAPARSVPFARARATVVRVATTRAVAAGVGRAPATVRAGPPPGPPATTRPPWSFTHCWSRC